MTCPNGYRADLNLGREKVSEWLAVYLTPAVERLQKLVLAPMRCIMGLKLIGLFCRSRALS